MSETNTKIGRLIHQIRQDRGITQAEFAKRLGTSQSAVNRIEHGNQNLSLEMLGRISDVLNKQLITINPGTVSLKIEGGHELKGEIEVKTSKNAAVAILCASLLNKGTTRLRQVAKIEEVNRIIEVLISIGVHVKWIGENDLEIKPPTKLKIENINKESAKKTRSVIMMVGPLMHDFKEFKIPYAGGCELGRRTILPHIYALEEFGVKIEAHTGQYLIKSKRLKPERSVVLYETGDTATENILMAAARTKGTTTIKLASANYMVQDLCLFLQKLGVEIEGIGSSTLKVKGVQEIKKNIEYWPSEDPVEAMTFISAGIATNSNLKIKRAPIEFLELELLKLEKMGLKFSLSPEYKANNGYTRLVDISIKKHDGNLKAPGEKIHPLPSLGINIDNLPYFIPICAVAKGRSLIHDWTFEDRALMFSEMRKIGVDLELADPHRVFINGPTKWRPTDMVAPSGIRPAVIILLGMLCAPGDSILRNVYTINRGYEDLAERLNSLGAKISVVHDI